MKKSLLEIVKNILSNADGQDVNSLSDTVEALQAAQVVRETFEDMISTRKIPEHESLLKLTALSDSDYPTYFRLENDQAKITNIWYDISEDNSFKYREVKQCSPKEFLSLTDKRQSNYVLVEDVNSGTKLRIANDAQPTWFTTFDDEHIVMDSFKSDVDDTLNASKTRVLGTTFPTFSISDDYVPDIDAVMFPYLEREATSRYFDIYKGSISAKLEQAAKRNKVHVQNDKHRVNERDNRRRYGRG